MNSDTLFTANWADFIVAYSEKLVLAIIVLILGRMLIGAVLGGIRRLGKVKSLEDTAREYLLSCVKIFLWVLLAIAVIQILGVPMASVITVLASCGLAVGLALQGALSNIAGGLMLMVFRPFVVGNYIATSGTEGVVKAISLFHTTLLTLDNKRVIIPNAQVMNAVITDFSGEELRRVDIDFGVAKSESPAAIQDLVLEAINATPRVLQDPAPFARISGGNDKQMTVTARAWCKSADYWDVYFDMTQKVVEAMGAKGVKAPAARIIRE